MGYVYLFYRTVKMNSAIFLFLPSVLVVTKTFGQPDYLDVDLEQDVENPTVASCNEIGALQKRSLGRDSNQSASVRKPDFDEESYIFEDDCVVYSDTCPSEIKISWLQASPFVYYRPSGNETENVTSVKGIFSDTFTRTIGVCCRKFAGTIPRIIYLHRSPSLKELQKKLFDGEADAIIPVHSNEGIYGGDLPYVEILVSPGVVLITKHSPSAIERGFLVWNAVKETWPLVLIAFLMSSVAGVFVWVLVRWTVSYLYWTKCISKCSYFFSSDQNVCYKIINSKCMPGIKSIQTIAKATGFYLPTQTFKWRWVGPSYMSRPGKASNDQCQIISH